MFIFARVAVALVATTAFIVAWQLAQLVIPDQIGVPLVIFVIGGVTSAFGYLIKQAADNSADNKVTIANLEDIRRRLDNLEHHQ